jgi:streptogramin lyase
VHGPAFALAPGFGSVWVAAYDGVVTRVNERSGRPTASIRGVVRAAEAVAVGFRSVWVAGVGPWRRGRGGVMVPRGAGALVRVDPATDRVVARIPVGRGASEVAIGFRSVWVTGSRGVAPHRTVARVDPRTNRVVATVRLRRNAAALTTGFGSVWAVEGTDGAAALVRIEPGSLAVRRTPLPGTWVATALVATRTAVWIAGEGSRTITRVNPRTLRVMSVTRLG